MLVPALVGVVLFQWSPLVDVIVQSLQKANPFTGRSYGGFGLGNYKQVFTDPTFRRSILNTAAYIVLTLVIEIPCGLVLAVLINQRLPSARFARGAIIAALAASEPVAALIWSQMYQPKFGLINSVFSFLHLPSQPLLTSPHQALIAITLMSVWRGVGLPMLVFLGGLQAIPDEVYDACALDGAGAVRQLWSVTLPMLRPCLVVAVFMSTLSGARIFTPISVMTQGGPRDSTSNLIFYSFQQAFSYQSFGTASAAAVVMLLLLVTISGIQARLLRG